MTDEKIENRQEGRETEKAAETATRKESAPTDNIYLDFMQKAAPSFGAPAEALKKIAAFHNDDLARALLIAALSGLTWKALGGKQKEEDIEKLDAEQLATAITEALRDRFRENDSLVEEIKETMDANKKVTAGWQAAFDEMKKLYDGSIAEMKDQMKAVQVEMNQLKKQPASAERIEPPVQSAEGAVSVNGISVNATQIPQAASSSASPSARPGFHLFARRQAQAPEPAGPADDAVEYQQNYIIFMKKFLENDDYSKEQKKFLLECWNNGDSVAKIETFARPKFDVEFMRDVRAALEKRQGDLN